MKVIITFTFCCDNLWKSKFMPLKSLENSGTLFSPTLWLPWCSVGLSICVCWTRLWAETDELIEIRLVPREPCIGWQPGFSPRERGNFGDISRRISCVWLIFSTLFCGWQQLCGLSLSILLLQQLLSSVIACNALQVSPVHSDGRPLSDTMFVRTGLLGFLGPVSNVLSSCFCILCNELVTYLLRVAEICTLCCQQSHLLLLVFHHPLIVSFQA